MLLIAKSTRIINNEELKELLDYEVPKEHFINQQFPKIDHCQRVLKDHLLILMLGGHPQAI